MIFAIDAGGMRRSAALAKSTAPLDKSCMNATGAGVSNGGFAAMAGAVMSDVASNRAVADLFIGVLYSIFGQERAGLSVADDAGVGIAPIGDIRARTIGTDLVRIGAQSNAVNATVCLHTGAKALRKRRRALRRRQCCDLNE